MSWEVVAFAIAMAALVVVIVVRLERSSDEAEARERLWLPDELRSARLLFAEPKAMRIERPVALVARVDRAYRDDNGWLTVVELKTRKKHVVYASDIVELSVQALVLEQLGHGRARDVGYVVTHLRRSGQRQLHRVQLLAPRQLLDLHNRYVALRRGVEQPRRLNRACVCCGCAYRIECDPPVLGGRASAGPQG